MHNDYELVYLAQDGNEDAINLIYQKYTPIIIKKSKDAILKVSHHGLEISDIMQEAYIGLDEAIKNYVHDNDASFKTFATLCIDRQILNYLRKVRIERNNSLNNAITIDDTLENVIRDNTNIELSLIAGEQSKMLNKMVKSLLTANEKKVFDLMMKGYSCEEIADILNKDVKAIYNTFQRIKNKIKKNIKYDN